MISTKGGGWDDVKQPKSVFGVTEEVCCSDKTYDF